MFLLLWSVVTLSFGKGYEDLNFKIHAEEGNFVLKLTSSISEGYLHMAVHASVCMHMRVLCAVARRVRA